MNISTLTYLLLIFSFQVLASHLSVQEPGQTPEQINCVENSIEDQGTCNCKDGYITDDKVNKCYSCLPNCKRCKPLQLNKCEECFGDYADPEKYCTCQKGYIYSSQMETCIESKNLTLEHLNHLINNKQFENSTFNFCKSAEEYAETSNLYKLKINNITNPKFDRDFSKLNDHSFVAYIQTKENLLLEKILLQKIKSRPLVSDFKETIFEINYIQGLSQTKDKNETSNLILMIDIKNVIQNSYYFLLMKCGYEEKQSLEEQKITESQVKKVVDEYFNLFYQCPSNCKKCTFSATINTTENESKVECKECINGMKLVDGKCQYENQPIKMKEIRLIQGQEEKTECDIQTYLKDEYCELCDVDNCEVCENQNTCKKCNNENFDLKEGKCECKGDKKVQCKRIQFCSYQNGNKCLQCENGYYLLQDECLKMQSKEYLLCIKEEKCYNCLNMEEKIQNSKESKNGICECEDGYFMNYRLLQCNQCDSSCRTCVDREIKCISCYKGYYLENNKCKNCPETCLSCISNEKCNNCADGNYLHQNECKKCEFKIQNKNACQKCNNEKSCTEAIEGYYVDQGKVLKCEIENCKKCKDKKSCEVCNPKYFVEKGSCLQCQEGCVTCDRNNEQGQTKCFNCSPNYTLSDEDGICKKCPSNCKQCATPNTCNECKQGFKLSPETQLCVCENDNEFFKNNKCEICVENCEVCESQDKCKICLTYFTENKGLCEKKPCKIKKCKQCKSDDKCDQCEDSIYNEKTKQCGCNKGNCETCTQDDSQSEQCTKCKPKYYLKQNECVESNCEDEDKDRKCKECKTGYFINSSSQCEKCSSKNCKKCDNNDCKTCQQSYYLQDNECKKCSDQCLDCEYDQEKKQVQCTTCMPGYSPKEAKCYKENNLFPLLALVFIIALIYGAFYFKEQILSLCQNQNQGFEKNFDQDVELTKKSKHETKPEDDFGILAD